LTGQARVTHGRKCCTLICIFREIESFCSGKREAATVVASLRRLLGGVCKYCLAGDACAQHAHF